MNLKKRYGYIWVTLALFAISLAGHWLFGWLAYVDEARAHGQAPHAGPYVIQMARDMFENWQSEFLQLIWQVAGLAVLLCVGSPQSKEQGSRLEEKIDFLLAGIEGGNQRRAELDAKYMRP